jgi:hypothetical protein
VSDGDVEEFVAAALSHRRGPGSVEALLAENERLEIEAEEGSQTVKMLMAENERLREALYELRNAEWMVTHDWGGDREAVLAKADAALAVVER